MQGQTFKCKSCGGYLTFEPNEQKWICPYCHSTFGKEELHEEEASTNGTNCEYHCTSCGSQIVTDETTVATHCYYCHSPVVLQSKISADKLPERVLPFSFDKDKARSAFADWMKKKRYLPKGFFDEGKVENLSGVYYPHFITTVDADAKVEGHGEKDVVHRDHEFTTTHTSHYHIMREGAVHFENIIRPALSSTNRKLSDGIHPFPLDNVQPFSSAYLSGFMAECRDIDQETATKDIDEEIKSYAKSLLSSDLDYTRLNLDVHSVPTNKDTSYVLLPTWVLTYPNSKDVHNPYYYAMNGITGKVCGKLPINQTKLIIDGVLIGALCYGFGLLISCFI